MSTSNIGIENCRQDEADQAYPISQKTKKKAHTRVILLRGGAIRRGRPRKPSVSLRLAELVANALDSSSEVRAKERIENTRNIPTRAEIHTWFSDCFSSGAPSPPPSWGSSRPVMAASPDPTSKLRPLSANAFALLHHASRICGLSVDTQVVAYAAEPRSGD